jgi:hypothetical protein
LSNHVNLFRDTRRTYNPQQDGYLESDPIGLNGGINTYAYARDRSVTDADPSGLFSMTAAFHWETVPEIPGNKWWQWIPFVGGNRLGFTSPQLSPASCTCQNCSGSWHLVGCSAALDVDVMIRGGMDQASDAWARRKEAEHVSDLQASVEKIKRAGATAVGDQQQRSFSSQSDCESESSDVVSAAINAAFEKIVAQSRLRDTRGDHNYPGSCPFEMRTRRALNDTLLWCRQLVASEAGIMCAGSQGRIPYSPDVSVSNTLNASLSVTHAHATVYKDVHLELAYSAMRNALRSRCRVVPQDIHCRLGHWRGWNSIHRRAQPVSTPTLAMAPPFSHSWGLHWGRWSPCFGPMRMLCLWVRQRTRLVFSRTGRGSVRPDSSASFLADARPELLFWGHAGHRISRARPTLPARRAED